jgi:hypothetical protein
MAAMFGYMSRGEDLAHAVWERRKTVE